MIIHFGFTKEKVMNIVIFITMIITLGLGITLKINRILYENKIRTFQLSQRCFEEKKQSVLNRIYLDFKTLEKKTRKGNIAEAGMLRQRLDYFCPAEVDTFTSKLNVTMMKEINAKIKMIKGRK